jgi:hypothetical protein
LVNALPFDRLSDALVQGSDGRLYGAVYISSQDSFYYSLSTSGQDLQQYPTGKWSSAWDMAVMPQGIYDRVGTIGNNQVWAFARIGEAGKVTIIYQLSPTDGIPNTKLVPAPDGKRCKQPRRLRDAADCPLPSHSIRRVYAGTRNHKY